MQAQGEYTRRVSGHARIDQYGFKVDLQNTPHYLHEGFNTLSLMLDAHVSTLGVTQEDLQRYRLLPIEAIIQTPAKQLDSGLFFAASMSLAAYAKLQGDTEALCHHIQQYGEYVSQPEAYEFLLRLNVENNLYCLLEHQPRILEKAFLQLSTQEQEVTIVRLLVRALSTSDYDAQLQKIDPIKQLNFQSIVNIRQQCRLEQTADNIAFTDQCLMSYITSVGGDSSGLIKKALAKKLEHAHMRYFSLAGGGTPNDRVLVFRRWQSIGDYLDKPICEKVTSLVMLAFQQALQQTFQLGLAPAITQLIQEASAIYQSASCTGAHWGKLDIHRLLTDTQLQQDVSVAIGQVFKMEGLRDKKLGEVIGELLRVLNNMEDRLFLSPVEYTLPLSKTYDISAVSGYIKQILLDLLGEKGGVFQRNHMMNKIHHVIDRFDFHLTFGELATIIDQSFSNEEQENYQQVRQFMTDLHHDISQHFLDPYMAEVAGLLLYGMNPQEFVEFSSQHRSQPNSVHKLYGHL